MRAQALNLMLDAKCDRYKLPSGLPGGGRRFSREALVYS